MRFVSEAIDPASASEELIAQQQGEPPLPNGFTWRGERLDIAEVLRTWRSTKDDRGDSYLARHWYEVRIAGGRTAILYFDRKALRNRARWWLYSISE